VRRRTDALAAASHRAPIDVNDDEPYETMQANRQSRSRSPDRLAFVTAAFGATEAGASAWQSLLVFAAPVILVLGLALQILVTARSSRVD
jgi:hypothetical protein